MILGILTSNISFADCEGDCWNGQGTYTWESGDEYVGEWKDGKRHGQGTQTQLILGSKYVGEWKDGVAHGQGTYLFPSGKKYVGEWKDGNEHGQGTLTYVDGKILKGEWKNGDFVK